MRVSPLVGLVLGIGLACADDVSAQTGRARAAAPGGPVPAPANAFRVCADPGNLPASNDRREGYENRIADVVATALGTTPRYVWWGQRQGFIRNTMNATLETARCEVMIAVPQGYDLVETTRPYFRSTYVFVYPTGRGREFRSLDDAALKTVKIGVHLLGDDYTNPPPVHELAKRGVVGNLVGFSTFFSAQNPPSAIIDAVAAGRVDVAIVWGPSAGYFVKRQKTPLTMVPVPSGPGDLPFAFDIAMGVKRGQPALKARLEQVLTAQRTAIRAILTDYGVPLVEGKAGPIR